MKKSCLKDNRIRLPETCYSAIFVISENTQHRYQYIKNIKNALASEKQVRLIKSQLRTWINFAILRILEYREGTFIRWHQFLWFLQHTLIHGFLNSWFQTLKVTVNGKLIFRWILIFVVSKI